MNTKQRTLHVLFLCLRTKRTNIKNTSCVVVYRMESTGVYMIYQ